MPRFRSPKRRVYVAFAPTLGLVKIGLSFGPPNRVKDLANERRTPVMLLGERTGSRKLERQTHDSVWQWQERGEWFYDSDDVRAAAAKMLRRPVDEVFGALGSSAGSAV